MTLIGLVTACHLLITGKRRALCGRQHLILYLDQIRKRVSNIIFQCDPASGVTSLALLAGSSNTTGARSQLSIRSGRDCIRERMQYDSVFANSISEFRLAVTMPKLSFELRP